MKTFDGAFSPPSSIAQLSGRCAIGVDLNRNFAGSTAENVEFRGFSLLRLGIPCSIFVIPFLFFLRNPLEDRYPG
jgi:hypothetical protein